MATSGVSDRVKVEFREKSGSLMNEAYLFRDEAEAADFFNHSKGPEIDPSKPWARHGFTEVKAVTEEAFLAEIGSLQAGCYHGAPVFG